MNHPLEKRHETCEAELSAALASITRTQDLLAEARRTAFALESQDGKGDDAALGRARRQIVVEFEPAQAAGRDAPEFLTLIAQHGDQWRCELEGPAGQLIRWAATQPIRDLSIGKPDLESLFRGFYRNRSDDG